MADIVNKILTGSSGNIWLNGQLMAQTKSIEAKITGNFEDINFVGDPSTHSKYTGWAGEGTLTMYKIDSTVIKLIGQAFKTGVMPDIKIITKLTDKNTGKSERVAISGITITEFILAKFEAKANVEEELPFKFTDYEILDTI
ncbi:phage tail tube protein [Clostridium butyricum]|uniref:phage tail tube protein n=1 Tax=Clostridium butyricum TaxID=1492 RepID=UPI002ABD77E5|nr:phage tail tube protein [Clostridium butyricum]